MRNRGYRQLGPGLPEGTYEAALCIELIQPAVLNLDAPVCLAPTRLPM